MFDDVALALEEIEPEDKARREVWGPELIFYVATAGCRWCKWLRLEPVTKGEVCACQEGVRT